MKAKKERKPINSIVLLFIILIIVAVLTHIIPAGSYERVVQGGREVVVADSFSVTEGNGASLFDIFRAVPYGMNNAVQLLIGFMVVGGAIEVVQQTGAINIGISRMIKRLGINRGNIVLIVMFYMFAALGGFLGFVEGSIPFMPIAISIAVGLGYDSIVGVAIALVGAVSGFTCGPTNPSSVGIAQSIAGLDIYSGMGMRIVMFLVIPLICLLYILWYARRVKTNPAKSLVADVDTSEFSFDIEEFGNKTFTFRHGIVLISLLAGILAFVFGAMNLGWNFNEMSAIFLIVALVAGLVGELSLDGTINTFVKGAAGMTNASFVLGIAYGVAWILSNANVLDTIVYYISRPLTSLPSTVSIIGIFIAIMLINLLIPSGSGKAAIVMPIVLPIADLMGINAQTAILAYQLGDGVTNLCTPLLGVLLLALGFGKIPFSKWERFILPLVCILFVVGCVFLFVAMQIGYC